MQESPDLLHYASNTEQFLKEFQWLIFNSISVILFQFVIVCLKSDSYCISTKFYEIYT